MSQLPASPPSSITSSEFARYPFMKARLALLGHHGTLASVSNKQVARAWAEEFGKLKVCPGFFLCSRVVLTCLQRRLSSFAGEAGVAVDKDYTVCAILKSAREHLVEFATLDWL